MRPLDIRKYKNDLRACSKERRAAIPADKKRKMDGRIAANVRRLYEYAGAETILVYVSTAIEVDTRAVIENAFADGKKVAVPRCIPDTRNMEFHYINGLDELSPGAFSVLEPDESAPVVTDFRGCLMLVPAFLYDRYGYRLGYGKGYYDRYISRFKGRTVGMCYDNEIRGTLYHGRFDRPVDVILTNKRIYRPKRYEAYRKKTEVKNEQRQ